MRSLKLLYLLCSCVFIVLVVSDAFKPQNSITWFAENHIYWAETTEIAFEVETFPARRYENSTTHKQLATTIPCTIITSNSSNITEATFNSIVAEFSADDVWTKSFLSCIYLQYSGLGNATLDASTATFFKLMNTSYLLANFHHITASFRSDTDMMIVNTGGNSSFPDGPYIAQIFPTSLSFSKVYAAARDYSASFQSPVLPSVNGSYKVQHLAISNYLDTFVPIPSRIYSRKDTRPLAGLRFGSKDIFPVHGVRMTGGSKAYFSVHNASESTCVVLQKLIDLGAVFVGTTKTFAFSSVDIASDYLMPWNPRGDGALNTGGSSIGSGSAISSYDWIDFTVGADTGGSVRGPANAGGVYGYRPTQGIMPLEGVIPAITEQDTAGHMARSPYLFSTVGKNWYAGLGGLKSYSTPPKRLLIGSDLTSLPYQEQWDLYHAFISKLERSMNITRELVNITEKWFGTSNISQSLNDWASPIYYDMNNVENWNEVGLPLSEVYGSLHNKAFPPVEIGLINQWHQGMNTTIIDRERISAAKRPIFKSWLEKNVIRNATESCTESILIYSNTAAPYYRTLIHDPFTTYIYIPLYIAAYAGNPEVTIPIGQTAYNSSRTNITELYPLTVNIQAAAGCHYVLFDMIEKLADLGVLKEVLPGKLAFIPEDMRDEDEGWTVRSGKLGTEENLKEGWPF